MIRRTLFAALAICSLVAGLATAATTDENHQDLLNLQESLKARLAAQPDDVNLTYQLGVAAYKLRDYLTALEMFERVLALNPNHAGAMLDMALAHYERGDYSEAQVLFNRLAGLPQLPPQVANVIASYQSQLGRRSRVWQTSASLGLATGRSNNVNQGLSGGAINLPQVGMFTPAETSLAKADWFGELTLDGRAERAWGDSRLYLVGGWRQRQLAHESDFNQRWLVGGAGVLMPLAPQLSLDSSVIAINGWLDGHALEHAGYLLNQLTLERGAAAHWLRVEADVQRFPATPSYAAQQFKLVLGSAWARPNWKVLGEIGVMRDLATRDRPGGNRLGRDWLLEGKLNLAPGWWLGLQWRGESAQQRAAFSPADFGPFIRRDYGHTANVSLSWEPSPLYRWELSALRSRINSNLDLYDLRRDELRLEWRRNWN